MLCSSCAKVARRRGRHRAHDCQGGITGTRAWIACGCICRQQAIAAVVARGGFPSMALPD